MTTGNWTPARSELGNTNQLWVVFGFALVTYVLSYYAYWLRLVPIRICYIP